MLKFKTVTQADLDELQRHCESVIKTALHDHRMGVARMDNLQLISDLLRMLATCQACDAPNVSPGFTTLDGAGLSKRVAEQVKYAEDMAKAKEAVAAAHPLHVVTADAAKIQEEAAADKRRSASKRVDMSKEL